MRLHDFFDLFCDAGRRTPVNFIHIESYLIDIVSAKNMVVLVLSKDLADIQLVMQRRYFPVTKLLLVALCQRLLGIFMHLQHTCSTGEGLIYDFRSWLSWIFLQDEP